MSARIISANFSKQISNRCKRSWHIISPLIISNQQIFFTADVRDRQIFFFLSASRASCPFISCSRAFHQNPWSSSADGDWYRIKWYNKPNHITFTEDLCSYGFFFQIWEPVMQTLTHYTTHSMWPKIYFFWGGFYPLGRNCPEPKHFWIHLNIQIQISLTRTWQFDAIVTCTTSSGAEWLHLRAILTHWHPFSDLLCFHNLCTYTTARCCIKDQMTYQSYRSPESVLFICLSEDSIGNQCTVSLILLIDWL